MGEAHDFPNMLDVVQAYEVLQSRFTIVYGLTCAWHANTMKKIIHTCIILHNMIAEDEQQTYDVSNDSHPILLQHTCKRKRIFMINKITSNLKQNWWSIFGNISDIRIMKINFYVIY
ncbi:hypothetical protein CR513_17817, partial [Mucuna pruriens]